MQLQEKSTLLEPLSVQKFIPYINLLDDSLPFLNDIQKSVDIMNILQNESKCDNMECNKSVEMLSSMFQAPNFIEKKVEKPALGINNMLKHYNEIDKHERGKKGIILKNIKDVQSEEQEIQQKEYKEKAPLSLLNNINFQKIPEANNQQQINQKIREYIPENLRDMMKEIPTEYLKGMIDLQSQLKFKTARRIRVEKYLLKRRLKTWNKKVCYNCRQKVAEQRIRLKGRFIGRKKAIQMFGIKQKMTNEQLKVFIQEKSKNEHE